MKPTKIQISKNIAWNQPPKMLDWEGYETIIPGLYLNRPLHPDETPAKRGWDVCHLKSGYKINPTELKNEREAKRFIELLATKNLNWEVTYEEFSLNSQPYLQAIRETWEAMHD